MTIVHVTGFFIFSAERYKADDDYIWFYLQGADINYSQKSDTIYSKRNEFMQCNAASNEYIYRSILRQELHKKGSYVGSSIFYSIGSWFIQEYTSYSPQINYPKYLSYSMWLGSALLFAATLLIAISVMIFIRNKKLLISITVASSLSLLIAILSMHEWSVSGRLIDQNILLGNLKNLVVNNTLYLLNPGPAFAPFDLMPKGRFQLLLMVAFLARWNSNYFLAYLLILPMSFVHQSYAGLVLFLMIAIDVIMRPRLFRDYRIVMVIVTAFAVYLTKGYLWKSAISNVNSGAGWFVGLLAFATVLAYKPIKRIITRGYKTKIYNIFSQLPIYQSDLLVYISIWFISLTLFIPISLTTDPVSSHYLWGQVHGRISGLFYPVILTGIVLFFVKKAERLNLNLNALAFTIVLNMMVFSVMNWRLSGVNFFSRVENSLIEHERNIGYPLTTIDSETGEYLFFYAMAKELETGKKLIDPLMNQCHQR
ncbi:MAG: hypothetical protein ABJN65_05795 [Parasphingorhabdus sp.]